MKPDYNGIRIDPCVPRKWKGYTVQRKFRGVTYKIAVSNPKGKSKGVKTLVVDGRKVAGNLVPQPTDGRTEVKVEVVLGS